MKADGKSLADIKDCMPTTRYNNGNWSIRMSEEKMPVARSLGRAFLRGLLGAGLGVLAAALFGAIWGGLFGFHPSATIYGTAEAGLEGAAATAMFCSVFWGPPLAFMGFVVAFWRAFR
jgi:hypothetical protein